MKFILSTHIIMRISKIVFLTVLIFVLGGLHASAEDTALDFSTTKTNVDAIRTVNTALPTNVSQQRGRVGEIISKLFDINGKIGNRFLKALGTTRADGYILRWTGGLGGKFQTGSLYDTGTKVGIGTTNPGEKLEIVNGSIRVSNISKSAKLYLRDSRASFDGEISQRSDGRISLTTRKGIYGTRGIEILDNGNIAIGKTIPGYKLDVAGDINLAGNLRKNGVIIDFAGKFQNSPVDLLIGDPIPIYYNKGNVAIGKTTPGYKLDVAGDINFTGNFYRSGALVDFAGKFIDGTNSLDAVYTGGNVGIGDTTPSYKLQVEGTIATRLDAGVPQGQGPQPGMLLGGYTSVDQGADIYMNKRGLIAAQNSMFLNINSDSQDSYDYIFGPLVKAVFAIGGGSPTVGATRLFTVEEGGDVGIGTSNPAYKLDVAGDINFTGGILKNGVALALNDLSDGNSDGNGNMGIGVNTLLSNTGGIRNIAIGVDSLRYSTTGSYNVSVGYNSLKTNTTGRSNVAIGENALFANISGGYNTAIGANTLRTNTTGGSNVGVGDSVMRLNTTGIRNTAVGASALYNNTTGGYNTAFGWKTLNKNTTGGGNTAIGTSALYSNTGGIRNTAIGNSALYNNIGNSNTAIGWASLIGNTSGASNSAIGYESLRRNTIGDGNSAFGRGSMYYNTQGFQNTAMGNSSLNNNTTGNYNVANGFEALRINISGNNNIGIGYKAGDNITTGSNNIVIGANQNAVTATGSSSLNIGGTIFGDLSAKKVGINTSNPQAFLHVNSGNNDVTMTSNNHGITVGNQIGANLAIDGNEILARNNGTSAPLYIQNEGTGNTLLNKSGGNVGIGTTAPGYKLEVAGNMELNGYAAIGPNAQNPSEDVGLRIGSKFGGNHDRNTFQTYINQTIPTTVLTGNRASYGNYTRLINNKGGTNTWGERSSGYGNYTFVETTGSNFVRYNVGGSFESKASTLSGAQDIRGVQGIVRQNDRTGNSTVVAAYGLEGLAYGETDVAGDSKIARARGVSALTAAYETDISTADGVYAQVQTINGDGGDIFQARGVAGYAIQDSAAGGNITNAYGGAFHTYARAGGPLIPIAVGVQGRADYGVNAYGGRFYAESSSSTNNYGVYIGARNATGNNWSIYSPYSNNYFGGNIGAGITNPTSRLSVLGNGGGLAVREENNLRDGFTVTADNANSYLTLKDSESRSVYLTTTNTANWIRAFGGLGIGTVTPGEKLSVAGRISLTVDPNSDDDVGDRGYNDARYLAVGSKASDSDLLDGIDSTRILAQQADIGGGINLNAYITTGLYHQNLTANASSGVNYPVALAGMLEVIEDGSMIYQKYTIYNSGTVYVRTKHITTWYPWKRQLAEGDSGDFIADNTIDSTEIQDNTLTEADIAPNAIGETAISDTFVARDSNLLDGFNSSQASTPSTVAVRNTSGDISTRLFRSEYDTTNGNIGYIMTQVDTVSNNYIRPSTPAQFRAAVTDSTYINIGSSGDQIQDNTIDNTEIQDNTLTAADLAPNSVGNSELIDTPTVTQLNMTAGNDNGINFWSSNLYKIAMGSGVNYSYGPVTSYSIKMNMSGQAGRGWTWGVSGLAPKTGLEAATGNFETAGNITTAKDFISNVNTTGGWSRNLGFSSNGANRANFGAYGSNNTLSYIYLDARGVTNPYSSSQFVLKPNGNVGIGTTTPSEKLQVNGNVLATAYFHSSDRRLKKNIKTISGLDIISKLRGVSYNWKKDSEASAGVIAQELESILPSAVREDEQGMKSVDYDQLIAPLIEAVKELQIQNKELAKQIKQLQK